MEVSFWRRLWTCRQTEYWMNEWMNEWMNVVYTHFILNSITLLILGVRYKLQSYSVSNFLWPTFWIQIQYYLTHTLTCTTHTSLSMGYWLFNTVFKRPQSIKIPSSGKWHCMAVGRYKHCGGIGSLHLQKMDPADFSETLVPINQTSWYHLNCNITDMTNPYLILCPPRSMKNWGHAFKVCHPRCVCNSLGGRRIVKTTQLISCVVLTILLPPNEVMPIQNRLNDGSVYF